MPQRMLGKNCSAAEKNKIAAIMTDIGKTSPFTYSKAVQKQAQLLFKGEPTFMLSVEDLFQLPEMKRPEIAFAGRSNVGKSSLLNALLNRKDIARTSNTPGRTQQLNFFDVAEKLYLVDMPGYGYAKVSKFKVTKWTETLKDYLKGRQNLHLVLLLVDSRHGFKPSDIEMIKMLNEAAVSCQIVLTKIDKVKADYLEKLTHKIENEIKEYASVYPHPLTTSSSKKVGFETLKARIFDQVFPG